MLKKKKIFIAASSVIMLIIVFFLSKNTDAVQEIKEAVTPNMYLTNIQINNITSEQAKMDMLVLFDNPLPVGLSIDSIFYTIFIENTLIAKNTYRDPLQIESGDSATISLPVTVNVDTLNVLLKELEANGKDSVDYAVVTEFKDNSMLTPESFNLQISKKLPLVKFPEIQIQNLKVKHVGLKNTEIEVTSSIENPNTFSVGLQDIQLQLQLDDNKVLKGTKDGNIELPSKSTTPTSFTFSIALDEAIKSLIDLIQEGKDLEFSFNVDADLVSDQEILKDGKIQLQIQENLQDLQKFAKSEK
ncbi:LEA type 2 family protein [Chondrinema litorale]|uniref:NDR1/HIN1-like protein n=1 Tax=Chondrinema litorale TaxID=2994555 RepID=UPI0025430F54|nr:LEA type 2 family protein [Chondrinema litorale]UZR96729.1 LEA type 2 family protein [Chondrinema litorale]